MLQILIKCLKIHSKYSYYLNKSKLYQEKLMKNYLGHPWTLSKRYTIHRHTFNDKKWLSKVTYSLADILHFEEFFSPTNCQIKLTYN